MSFCRYVLTRRRRIPQLGEEVIPRNEDTQATKRRRVNTRSPEARPVARELASVALAWTIQGRELLRHIGDTLSIQGKMVGRVEVQEKPELLWESPELEQLYLRLEDEYELQERHLALERKLELIARTAETLLELLQHKRSLRVEWYIVILILVEIMITLHEKLY